jgi:hypothetical protein
MENNNKLVNLRNLIEKKIIEDFNMQINEVLSICESEIERLMILHLYNYFLNYKRDGYWNNRFYRIEFIEDEILLGDPNATLEDEQKNQNRIKKYNYRLDKIAYLKHIGYTVEDSEGEWLSVEELVNKTANFDFGHRIFEVRPQYLVNIDGTHHRIDIAIFLNRYDKFDKLIETRKIALECDGYDYHSSPEQKRNDDIRTRKLKKNGWREVFRYSGKELYSIKYINEVHKIFEEIIEMLYLK